MQCSGPFSEATVHRLHHSQNHLDRFIKGLHLKQIVKVWGPRPLSHLALAGLLLPMKGWEGQVPPCSTMPEISSLGASVVWDEMHSCSRLLACFLSPPVCCSPAAQDYFPIYTARREGWNHSQTDATFLNECKSNTDTQMSMLYVYLSTHKQQKISKYLAF